MSTAPSRRALLRGLFAVGLGWLGLRRGAEAAAVPASPLTDAPSRLTGHYCRVHELGHVTTLVYDIRDRLVTVQGQLAVDGQSRGRG